MSVLLAKTDEFLGVGRMDWTLVFAGFYCIVLFFLGWVMYMTLNDKDGDR